MANVLASRQLGEGTDQGICIPSLGSMVLVAHQRGVRTFLLLQSLIQPLLLLPLLLLQLLVNAACFKLLL